MNPDEYLWVDEDRCRVMIPLGSRHPSIAFAALRLRDNMRLIIYRDGTYVEALA